MGAVIALSLLANTGIADDSTCLHKLEQPLLEQPRLVISSGTADFWSPITNKKEGEETNLHCRNWGENSFCEIDSFDNPLLGKDTRILLDAYDDDNDGNVDWIRLGVDRYNVDGKGGYDGKAVSFYKGPAHLKHMLEQYGGHLSGLEGKVIPENEIGITEYDGSKDGAKFTLDDSPLIRDSFAFLEKIYADIYPLLQKGKFKVLPHIGNEYSSEIQRLFATLLPAFQ